VPQCKQKEKLPGKRASGAPSSFLSLLCVAAQQDSWYWVSVNDTGFCVILQAFCFWNNEHHLLKSVSICDDVCQAN